MTDPRIKHSQSLSFAGRTRESGVSQPTKGWKLPEIVVLDESAGRNSVPGCRLIGLRQRKVRTAQLVLENAAGLEPAHWIYERYR